MNPYSHIVVASKLTSLVQPENLGEYYWGAVVPDIRYLVRIKRERTHLSPQTIFELSCKYPHLKSFLQGYLIHCLSDEIELRAVALHHFPFSLFKGSLYHQRVAVLLELSYLEKEKLRIDVAGSYNEVLAELGLSEAAVEKFSQFIRDYIVSPSYEARVSALFQLLGRKNDSRVEKYMRAAKGVQKNRVLRNVLFLALRTGKVSEEIVARVALLWSSAQTPV
jgi:hypothetical protein